MNETQRVRDLLLRFPQESGSAAQLSQLREFVDEMTKAGVVLARKYDLPLPDTLSRSAIGRMRLCAN